MYQVFDLVQQRFEGLVLNNEQHLQVQKSRLDVCQVLYQFQQFFKKRRNDFVMIINTILFRIDSTEILLQFPI